MAVAVREKIKEHAAPYLKPGETVQAALAGQTFNGYWAFLSALIVLFKNAYRAIVVTDQRIIVFNTGRWSQAKVKEVLRELPRSTPLPAPHGLWFKTEAFGERLYIHKRFHKDIEAAAAATPR